MTTVAKQMIDVSFNSYENLFLCGCFTSGAIRLSPIDALLGNCFADYTLKPWVSIFPLDIEGI
jgi:hypothetical protein